MDCALRTDLIVREQQPLGTAPSAATAAALPTALAITPSTIAAALVAAAAYRRLGAVEHFRDLFRAAIVHVAAREVELVKPEQAAELVGQLARRVEILVGVILQQAAEILVGIVPQRVHRAERRASESHSPSLASFFTTPGSYSSSISGSCNQKYVVVRPSRSCAEPPPADARGCLRRSVSLRPSDDGCWERARTPTTFANPTAAKEAGDA